MGTNFSKMEEITIKPLALGTVIQERYSVAEYVAEGGMGQLYKVRDLRLEGMIRAMKVLKPELLEQTRFSTERESEAKLLTLLQHQGLPMIYDHFHANEQFNEIIVMEWIEGQQLEQFCIEQKSPLCYELILSMSIELIEAIQYLHEQSPAIIHRDIKPTNIMICRNGHIKLIDFGISKRHRTNRMQPTVALGTPGFAAPEQMKGIPTDERSDLYSFGCILYFLCTKGKQLANQYDLQQIEYIVKRELAHIPIALRHLILHCLQPDPQYRIVQASQVKTQLLQLTSQHSSLHDTYSVKQPLYNAYRSKSIAIFSLHPQAGATTIAMLLAQHYALHERVKLIEFCGPSACLESIPIVQKRLAESNLATKEIDPYYKEVTIDLIEHHMFHSSMDTNSSDATDSFIRRISKDSSADVQVIDFSSGWSAELVEQIREQLSYVVLVCDPSIIVSNERNFRNIQRLLAILEKYNISYTWINNKDCHFSGRKAWNLLNNGREVYSIAMLSTENVYSEMWSRHWLSGKTKVLKKLKNKLMPLIKVIDSSLERVD